MLQKLRLNLTRWASNYSNKSSAVKLGSPLGTKKKRIKTYISNKWHRFKLGRNEFIDKYQVKNKLLLLLEWKINILVTGFIVQYCFENRNPLSYGFSILLFMYYFEKIVTIIKQPIKKNEEK